MTETELLNKLLDTEIIRLLTLAFLAWCIGMIYSIIGSARFNNRLLTLVGQHSAALDRNTDQQRKQDGRMDQLVSQDYVLRERGILSMEANTDAMKRHTAAFTALQWALNSTATMAEIKHTTTHEKLEHLGQQLGQINTTLESLDHSTRQVIAPLEQIIQQLGTFINEARQVNSQSVLTLTKADEILALLVSAQHILELAAQCGPPEPLDEKGTNDETFVAHPDSGADPAGDGQPGAGSGNEPDRGKRQDGDQSVGDGRTDFGVWSGLPGGAGSPQQTAAGG